MTGPVRTTNNGFSPEKLQFRLGSAQEMDVGRTLVVSVQPLQDRTGRYVFRTVHNEPEQTSWTMDMGVAEIMNNLLSDKNPEFGLANRVMHVLPEDSPLIPASIPLNPPPPPLSISTVLFHGLLIVYLLGLLAAILERLNPNRKF